MGPSRSLNESDFHQARHYTQDTRRGSTLPFIRIRQRICELCCIVLTKCPILFHHIMPDCVKLQIKRWDLSRLKCFVNPRHCLCAVLGRRRRTFSRNLSNRSNPISLQPMLEWNTLTQWHIDIQKFGPVNQIPLGAWMSRPTNRVRSRVEKMEVSHIPANVKYYMAYMQLRSSLDCVMFNVDQRLA